MLGIMAICRRKLEGSRRMYKSHHDRLLIWCMMIGEQEFCFCIDDLSAGDSPPDIEQRSCALLRPVGPDSCALGHQDVRASMEVEAHVLLSGVAQSMRVAGCIYPL